MTRTRRFLGGLATGYVNQVVLTIIGIWLTAFLLKRLGQEEYGMWLVGAQIIGYLALLDLGVITLLPREIAARTGRSGSTGQTELSVVFGRTLRLTLWQMPLVVLVGAIIWIAIPTEWEPLRVPLGIVMVVFVISFPLRTLHSALQGLQDLAFLGTAHMVTWVIGTIVTVGLVLQGFGLLGLAVGWTVTQLFVALLWWIRIRRKHGELVPKTIPHLSKDIARDRLTRGMWVSISQVAQILLRGTHLLLIGKILGPAAVVPYFCTEKLLLVLGNQANMIPQTAIPALSELRASEERSRLGQVTNALGLAVMMTSGGISCIILALNEGFIEWWVGEAQYGGMVLTVTLLAGMALRHWNSTAVYTLFAFGRERRLAVTVLSDGIITFVTALALIQIIGPLGAAIASLFGVCAISLPSTLTALARELRVRLSSILTAFWPWFWRFGLLATSSWLLGSVWQPTSFFTLAYTTIAVTIAYGAVMLPLALRDPLGTYVKPRLATLSPRYLRRVFALDEYD